MGTINFSFRFFYKTKLQVRHGDLFIFVGFLVTCLVIASIFLINSEEKDKYSDLDKSNEVDYDGMGNYGRFPQKINFFF